MSKRYAKVNPKSCVACGACTKVCPKSVISIFNGCYAVIDSENCLGCGKCHKVCPTGCIEIKEREML